MPKQLILAHRGYSGISPENTQLAFEMAHQFAFDGVELDVHLTKDEHLVIIHDETTLRTAGTKKEIETSTLAQLKEDDHSKYFKYTTLKQEIMTLEEFLDLYLDKFSVINVEIKTDEKPYPGIEIKIDQLSQKYGKKFFDKIIFSSFNFDTLVKMKDLNPDYQLAFLWWKKREFSKIKPEEIKRVCNYLNPWTVLYDQFKNEYRKYDLPFMLWTIKSEASYQKYKQDHYVIAQISNYKYD